jgi:long-chain fatty acid transport protein
MQEDEFTLSLEREPDMRTRVILIGITAVFTLATGARLASGQGYGSDLQNVMGPASGGMAGVSTARPQDVPSAIFGNPATLAQFEGTQFTMGGGWIEGYPTVTNDGSLNQQSPGTPFSATSRTQGGVASEIGVAQDLRSIGLPGTMGMGLTGLSNLGDEYRGRVPESANPALLNNLNDESASYLVLGLNMGAGFQLTDRLSVGASMTLGTGFEQLAFIGPISGSAMVNSYALRGTVGVDYDLNDCNTVGFYYQSKMGFDFPNAIRVGSNYLDVKIAQPATFGWGIANRSLMDGNLLIAADIYFKDWEDAALWKDVWVNQWAVAVGTQLTRDKMKYRLGYSWNSNPTNHNVGTSFVGIPVLQSQLQFYQAAILPAVNQNRITGGIGRQDFLLPGMDLDLFAGGMLPASDTFGPHNSASLAVYYIGLGMTWRYDASRHTECPGNQPGI